MKKYSWVIAFCAMSLLWGCATQKEITPPATSTSIADSYLIPSTEMEDTLLWYSKTPCFGACPTFSLLVKMNGQVLYHGKQHVEKLGEFTGQWTADQLSALETEMKKIQFYQLSKIYDDSKVTDLPSMYIGYTKGNQLYKIKCRYQYPNELKSLAKWLDSRVAQTELIINQKIEKQ